MLAAAVLPSLVVVVAGWWFERKALIETTEAQLRALGDMVAATEEQAYEGARQLLTSSSAVPGVQQQDPQRCNQYFSSLHQRFPYYGNMGATDKDGRVICSAVPPTTSIDVSDRGYFKAAAATSSLAIELVVGRVTGRTSLTFAMPFLGEEGAFAGVVFAARDVEQVEARLQKLKLPPYVDVIVGMVDGRVLAAAGTEQESVGQRLRNPQLRALVVERRHAEVVRFNGSGTSSLGLVRLIGEPDQAQLLVAVRADIEDVLAPAWRRLQFQLSVLLIAAMGGGLLAWWIGTALVVAPTRKLLQRIQRLQDGEGAGPGLPHRLTRELAVLNDAFSAMAERLSARTQERERLLRHLQETQQKLLAAQDVSRLGYWELDPGTHRLAASPMVLEILGCDESRPLVDEEGLLALAPPGDREVLAEALEGVRARPFDLEHRLVRPDGMVVWVRTIGRIEDGSGGARLVGSMQDISARKLTEASLHRSKTLLDMAGRMSSLCGWSMDVETRRLWWTDEVRHILELPQASEPRNLDSGLSYVAPAYRPVLERAFAACAEQGQGWDLELEVVTHQGHRRWIRSMGEAKRDERGQIVAIHGAVQDITPQRTAEQSLRELAERLTSTLESITDGFFTLDQDWRFTYVNQRAERMLQRHRTELLGHNIWALFPDASPAYRKRYEQALREQQAVSFEEYYEPLSLWTEVTAYPSQQGLTVYFRDISDRKAAEKEIDDLLARERAARREAEKAKLHFRALFESAPGLYLVLAAEDPFCIVAVSEAYLKATYTRREDLIGKAMFDAFPADPADPDGVRGDGPLHLRQSLERVRSLGRADVMAVQRYPIRRPEELGGGFEERFWSPLNSPVFGPDGELVYIIHRVEDVTEFMRQKERAGEAAEGHRLLETRAEQMEADIVLRSQELQRLNERLRAAQRVAQLGTWEHHLTDNSISWSEETFNIFGATPSTFDGSLDAFLVMVHPADVPLFEASMRDLLQDGPQDLEYRIVRSDGAVRHVYSRAVTTRNEAGVPVLLSGTIQDVTDRKLAKQRLQTQLARMQLLHQITRAIGERMEIGHILQIVVERLKEHMPLEFCAVASLEESGHGVVIDHVAPRVGQASGGMPALRPADLLPVGENGLSRAVQGELVYEPDIRSLPFDLPTRLAAAGLGSLVLVPLRASQRTGGLVIAARIEPNSFSSPDCEFLAQLSEHVVLAVRQAELHGELQKAFDELRRTQQAVLQHERLRALGEMASGIAHDLNNAISPVSLYTESLLNNEKGISEAGRSKLRMIDMAIDDVANTLGRMREFYRPKEPDVVTASVSPNDIVRQVLEFTRARWCDMPQRSGVTIELRTELAPELPRVDGNEGELREALTNLIFNAVDAMPLGGTLACRTRLLQLAERGSFVEISVEDSGVGMDEPTRLRSIEPFFTTKGERGTGLGLAMVYGTAQRHHGDLLIESTPGEGTVVRLRLPCRSVPVESSRRTEDARPLAGLRLLAVDDDPLVLTPLAQSLAEDGHHVITAPGGAEALDTLRDLAQRGQTLDAVITDLGMAHVDGKGVAKVAKELFPATLVVMLTGWGRRMLGEGEVPAHVDRLLSKPPRMTEIRAALSAARRPGSGSNEGARFEQASKDAHR